MRTNIKQDKPEAVPKETVTHQSVDNEAIRVGDRAVRAQNLDNTTIVTGDHNVIIQDAAQLGRIESSNQQILELIRQPQELLKLEANIDALSNLYTEGILSHARVKAEQLRRTLPVNVPPKLKHRLFSIIGGTTLLLGEEERAVVDFEAALSEDPDNVQLLENAANANLLAGDFCRADERARRALERNRSTTAMMALIQTTHKLGGRDQVNALLEENPWINDEQPTRTALAVTLMQDDELDAAEPLLRAEVPETLSAPHEADQVTFLAEIVIEKVQQSFANTQPAPWGIAEEDAARLAEAEALTTRVIDYWRGKEPTRKLGRALAERATVSLLRRDNELALKDLNELEALGYEDDLSRMNRVRILLDQDENPKVIKLVEKLPETERIKGFDGLLGAAYYKRKNWMKAAAAFERELPKAQTVNERLASLEPLLDLYSKLKDAPKADRVRQLLEAEGKNRATSLACLATYYYNLGDEHREHAHGLFRRAVELPIGSAYARFEYAEVLAQEGRWPEAVELVSSLIPPDAHPSSVRRYAAWLYNAGRYPDALAYTSEVREQLGVQVFVTDIEVELRLRAGDHARVVPLLEELIDLEPEDQKRRLSLTAAYLGSGDVVQAKAVIGQVDVTVFRGQPRDLLWLAQVYQALGIDGATELAWEAQRTDPHNHDLFTAFTHVLSNDGTVPVDLSTAAVDTTVTLEDAAGGISSVTLLEREDLQVGEYSTRGGYAQALLGRHVGDTLPWGRTSAGPVSVTVKEVRHKYVARFNDTKLDQLPTDAPKVEMYQLVDGQLPENFLRRLAEQAEQANEIFSHYRQHSGWPLHSVGVLLGLSYPKMLERLRFRGERVNAFDGSPHFLRDMRGGEVRLIPIAASDLRRQQVEAARRVVIDDSALLTLAELDALPLLAQRFDEVVVPQTVLGMFDGEIIAETGRIDPPTIPSRVGAVARAREWAREHATVVPNYHRLEATSELLKEYRDIVAVPEFDALDVAHDLDLPLYTDDLGLSQLVSNNSGLRTTNTRHLLEISLLEKHLTPLSYTQHMAQLADLGYSYVSFGAAHIMLLFEAEGCSRHLKALLNFLAAPATSHASAFSVATEFLDYLVFAHVRTVVERGKAIVCVFNALAKGRTVEETTVILERAFRRAPSGQLLPLVIFRKHLERWFKQKTKGRAVVDASTDVHQSKRRKPKKSSSQRGSKR